MTAKMIPPIAASSAAQKKNIHFVEMWRPFDSRG
jgi:hypothetical protein